MAMADTDERAGIEEQHLCASVTSSLLVDVNHRTKTDVILAAGMTRSQLGLALVHLRSEWDRTDKPRKRTEAEIAQRVAELKAAKVKDPKRRALTEALVWHAAAMRQRAADLSGRSVVMGLLTEWAQFYGVDQTLLSPALFHWLSPACPVCDGHGVEKMQDAPTLSNKSCLHCRGTRTWPRPLGAERVHNHIKSCIGQVRAKMAQKLYG